MPKYDPEREAHKAWLGLLQPVGLVVSPPALTRAQVVPDANIAPVQQRLEAACERPPSILAEPDPQLLDFPRFAADVLGWQLEDLAGAPGGPPLPPALSVHLPNFGDTLTPDYVALDPFADDAPLLLISTVDRGLPLDAPLPDELNPGWQASPQARLERLLRETGVPAGLLLNGDTLRLVYAPRGESSGHVGFPIAEMHTVHGRPILAAMHMLLGEHRVFAALDGQRLLDLLVESRKYQNEVSTRLAEQVLDALWALLRGFQAADDAAHNRVLFDLARTEPDHIYGGVLTVIMRLVFLLYAEDRGLMPDDPIYSRNYAVGGLFEQLRLDAGRHPDTMDQRYGAWSRLLSTFRLVHDGARHGTLRLPARHGQLFDPDAYPFLEGRPIGVGRVIGERFDAPRVSDGVLWRVLDGLLMLDGERLSYRALDVEQIGSVYEAMMGFDVETLPGRAIAVRPKDIVVDLDALSKQPPAKRKKWLEARAETKLGRSAGAALKSAETIADLVAALDRKVSRRTPRPLPPGALFLQPGEERRRSGSHYTPRELTEPIVRTTLRPVLEGLGEKPTPEQILDLKVCDPAMGSGAFLVEACRQLAEALVDAWALHGRTDTDGPPGEEPLLHARRRVAQRCIYGVDKNPFAVNLAKLSLWLVTLSRDHAFTFLDHALKCGDSLVGLTVEQIAAFDWRSASAEQVDWLDKQVKSALTETLQLRGDIRSADLDGYLRCAEAEAISHGVLESSRQAANLVLSAFFSTGHGKARPAKLASQREQRRSYLRTLLDGPPEGAVDTILDAFHSHPETPAPFHWELEFPEVFATGGFHGIVGNPPFLGGTRIGGHIGIAFHDYLNQVYEGTTGLTDLVAFFLRRSYELLRPGGALGLVTTNSIAQGDTREGGLGETCRLGGHIFAARRRVVWPGVASVVVSVVHLSKPPPSSIGCLLDGQPVDGITPFLLKGHSNDPPQQLASNRDICFTGTKVWGAGFVFEEQPSRGSSSLEDYAMLRANSDEAIDQVVRPFLGGVDFNSSPTHEPSRLVIDFGDMPMSTAQRWPSLFQIVEERVKPVRATNKQRNYREEWWKHANRVQTAPEYSQRHGKVLASTIVSPRHAIGFVPDGTVIANSMVIFLLHQWQAFGILQSHVHEYWARFMGSSMKDDPRYITPCFETFPLPDSWAESEALALAGSNYHDFRAKLMVETDQGLTATYNRFHDPDEHAPDIVRLRELHAEMDRAVLDAYGWHDIPTDCEFLLDYEIDEETWGKKKKPYRYRWPDAVHDEVLARLLDLNQQRYQQEVAAGLHAKGKSRAKKAAKPRKKVVPAPKPVDDLPLFSSNTAFGDPEC